MVLLLELNAVLSQPVSVQLSTVDDSAIGMLKQEDGIANATVCVHS